MTRHGGGRSRCGGRAASQGGTGHGLAGATGGPRPDTTSQRARRSRAILGRRQPRSDLPLRRRQPIRQQVSAAGAMGHSGRVAEPQRWSQRTAATEGSRHTSGDSHWRACDAKREARGSGRRGSGYGAQCRRMVHGEAITAATATSGARCRGSSGQSRDAAAASGERGWRGSMWRARLARQHVVGVTVGSTAGAQPAVTARSGRRRDRDGGAKQAGAAL